MNPDSRVAIEAHYLNAEARAQRATHILSYRVRHGVPETTSDATVWALYLMEAAVGRAPKDAA